MTPARAPLSSLPLLSYENQVVLISGAGRGLGRALSILLSRLGAQVILVSKTSPGLEETASQMAIPPLLTIQADLGHSQDLQTVLEKGNTLPHLDLLINNVSGDWFEASFADTRLEQIDNFLSVSLRAGLLLSHGLLKKMQQSTAARIVNILSPAVLSGPGQSATVPLVYAAAKAGAAAFSEGLRGESKPLGIGVISVYPGPFANTSHVDDLPERVAQKQRNGALLHVRAVAESILWAASAQQPLLIESLTLGGLPLRKRFSSR